MGATTGTTTGAAATVLFFLNISAYIFTNLYCNSLVFLAASSFLICICSSRY